MLRVKFPKSASPDDRTAVENLPLVAKPKSPIRGLFATSMNMLSGFRSLWIMP